MNFRQFSLLLFSFLISCFGFCQNKKEKRCKKILKNDYSTVTEAKVISVVDNDTINFIEFRYECVWSAKYISKNMYDNYGKWTRITQMQSKRLPLYILESVKLFDNDNRRFIVATSAVENVNETYASVMVFDENYNDLLTNESELKTRLKKHFGNLIKSNNPKKKDFYSIDD